MTRSTNYYGPHATKEEYNYAFNKARQWALGEGSKEQIATAAKMYHVKTDSLRKVVSRAKITKERTRKGVVIRHGGQNKVLTDTQEEAIRQYCYEQWEMGFGATHQMVLAAISYLRQVYT